MANYKCNICGYEGKTREEMRNHIRNEHSKTKEQKTPSRAKRWAFDLLMVLLVWFLIVVFTGYGVGFLGGVVLAGPTIWISNKLWKWMHS